MRLSQLCLIPATGPGLGQAEFQSQSFSVGWPRDSPKVSISHPPSLRPQQTACKSLRELWLPDTGWLAAKGGVLAPVPARWGGRRALLIPQEKAPWHTEKKKQGCQHCAPTLEPWSIPQSLPGRLSTFTVQGAWIRVTAGHTEVAKGD